MGRRVAPLAVDERGYRSAPARAVMSGCGSEPGMTMDMVLDLLPGMGNRLAVLRFGHAEQRRGAEGRRASARESQWVKLGRNHDHRWRLSR